MKKQEVPIVAWIGLDWADQEHYICLQAEGCEGVQSRVLKHEPEAIQQWVQQLRRLFPQGRVALALEQSRGPLIYALMHYEFLILYPVPRKRWPNIGRPSVAVEPKTIPVMPPFYWKSCAITGPDCGPGNRTMSGPGSYSGWWNIEARRWISAPL